MPLQWFPGHMTKAVRQIKENLCRADIVIEVLDARIPYSSRNPMIDDIVGKMPRLIVLNKADLADPNIMSQWEKALKGEKENIQVVQISARTGKNLSQLIEKAKYLCQNASWAGRRAVRAMVLGVPNVGKSAIINYLSGRKSRNVENRPGVTRGKQWVTVDSTLQLLDTPGILWPKFEDPEVGMMLAYTGAVKEGVIDIEELSSRLMELLNKFYPETLKERYKVEAPVGTPGWELLEMAGRNRGYLMARAEVNLERMAKVLMDEFRSGKLGKFTLEMPEEE